MADESIALRGEGVERLGQGDPHRVERAAEVADLVAAARIHRGVEVALRELAGRRRQALDAGGDQAGDQEADQRRDEHRDDQRGEALPASACRADRTSSGRSEIDSSTPWMPWTPTSCTATSVRSLGQIGIDVEVAVEGRRDRLPPTADRVDVEARRRPPG